MTDDLNDDQRARIAAENEQRRLGYLYEVTSTLFGEPLEVARRLSSLAKLLVPDMGDWCWIDLVEGTGLVRAVTHHWNPLLLAEIAAKPSDRTSDPNAVSEPTRVVRAGDSELVVDVLGSVLDAPGRVRSLVRVLLRDSDTVIGVVSLAYAESHRKYRSEDLALVQAVATRAGWALQAARQYEVATKAVTAREDILAVVAHDLRGPLGNILLVVEALRSTAAHSLLERVERAGARMERLISDLLDWSSLESGHLKITVLPVSVASLLHEAGDALAPQAKVREQTFEITGPDEDVLVVCDRARTFQVIANLVGNAIKFTPKGRRIALRAELEASFVRFTVSDEGPGIAADHLPHVFKRYWQAEAGTDRRRGIGLGLAIASGIVTTHGGTIRVTSPPGSGAQFSFTLPRAG